MDWPMFRRVERQATRLHEMIDRLGIDPVALVRLNNGEAYHEARAACLFCHKTDACLAWLDGTMQADQPGFCPNLELLKSMPSRKPDAGDWPAEASAAFTSACAAAHPNRRGAS